MSDSDHAGPPMPPAADGPQPTADTPSATSADPIDLINRSLGMPTSTPRTPARGTPAITPAMTQAYVDAQAVAPVAEPASGVPAAPPAAPSGRAGRRMSRRSHAKTQARLLEKARELREQGAVPVAAPPPAAPVVAAPIVVPPAPSAPAAPAPKLHRATPPKRAAQKPARVRRELHLPRVSSMPTISSMPSIPGVNPWAACAVVGALMGALGAFLVSQSLTLCTNWRGTESCGGPGVLVLMAIFIALVYLGGFLLAETRVEYPVSTSLLGVGVLAVASVVCISDDTNSVVAAVASVAFGVAGYTLSRWITVHMNDEDVLDV